MSYIARPEDQDASETILLRSLDDLATSSNVQFLRKASSSSIINASVLAGTGISIASNSSSITISTSGTFGHTIKDEGSALTIRTNLNFIGASVTATDNAGTDSTDITITGGTITGSDTQVLFFDGANNPAGDADLIWNKTTKTLTINSLSITKHYNVDIISTADGISPIGIAINPGSVTTGDNDGGSFNFIGGNGSATGSGKGGDVSLGGGDSGRTAGAAAGDITIVGGAAWDNCKGGDVFIVGGTPQSGGTAGHIYLADGGGLGYLQVNTASFTTTRIATFPNKSGTVAYLDDIGGGTITGSGTINEITYWTGATSLGTLAVATYPSLTELSYVKNVTSAIQTQLGNKQPQLNGTGFVKASGTTISYDNSTYITGIGSLSIDALSDVVITTVAKNQHLIFNGTNWVNAADGTTFTFSCTAFDDGLTTGILAGAGVWKAAEAIAFTATYDNGPPTTADVKMSINGGAYSDVGNMDSPNYLTGKNYDGAINYPTVDQYLRFRLDSTDGTDSDIDYAASLYFYNYIYYGASTIGSSFSEANVEALTGTISPSYTTSRSINAGASNYVVWAYPSRYTSIHTTGAIFNSVTMPFTAPETVSITNSAGLQENYKVFASTLTALGNSTLQLSTSSTTIDKLYYGKTSNTSGFLEAEVEALTNSTVSNDNTQIWSSVTTGAGEYMLFAFPTRLGTPTFWVGGFEGGFESPETLSITNVNGYVENYYVWRSSNANLGATVVETK